MRSLSIIIVSGLSGSGKSKALEALEDLGYFCVDNLPPVFLPRLAELSSEKKDVRQLAVGIDVRARGFLDDVEPGIESLHSAGHDVSVLFLDCSDEALMRRFSETRRPHPLARDRTVSDGIREERLLMSHLRDSADMLLDTTHFHVHELRRELVDRFGPSAPESPGMQTRIVSFGFKYGVPTDADLVLDVRFLPNPYFVDELRKLKGTDDAVSEYVTKEEAAVEFLKSVESLLKFLIPCYRREGRAYLTLAVGCTGGRHRSVTIAEELSKRLGPDQPIKVMHRDINRDALSDAAAEKNRLKEEA